MRWLALALLFTVSPAFAADPPQFAPGRAFMPSGTKFGTIIDPKTRIEELGGDGFKWTEGPVWDAKNKRLLFSDIPNNRVVEWSEAGKFKDFLKPAGFTATAAFTGKEPGSNGLAFDKDGTLVLCQHGDRRVAKLVDGKFVTHADKYNGKRLNSPNDLVYAKNGDLYFTDPPYGLPGNVKDPAKELDFQGVYRLKPSGELTLLTKDLSRPNGIGLSPDGKTLYVANSDPERPIWMSFPVKDDGTLGEGKVFADASLGVKAKLPGLPDGLKVDTTGNVWATGPNGVTVFAADGKEIGKIITGVPTANVGFGGDGSMLYITANDKILRVQTKVKGLGF